MSTVEDAATLLHEGPIADVGHLLRPGGRHEIDREIARIAGGGLRAHVVLVPVAEELAPLHTLWMRLGYAEAGDLLLLFNGHRWEARGWGLSRPAIDAALAAAEPGLRLFYGRGLANALANLSEATGRAPARAPARPSSLGGIVAGAAGLGLAAAVAWVIVRRRRRGQESRHTLAEARSSADKVFAEVVLATEDMAGPDGAELRDKATRIHDQIDAIAPPSLKQLPAKEETLTVARLLQMENELEALRSRVLQTKRRS